MDSLVDDNFSEIRKTFTDPLYNAMGLHVEWGLLFTIAAPATITVSVAVRRLTA